MFEYPLAAPRAFVTLLAAVFKMASVDHAVECVVSNSDADEVNS